MKRLSFSNVLSALVAGFIFGSAEPVFSATTSVPVGVSQEEPVLYALTLVDADTKDPLTENSTSAQVCLTVSVPRTGITGIATTLRAIPATLMYRPHGGEGSAWSGAIYLTAEDSGYYPMPQQGDINRDVVSSGASIPDTLTSLTVGTVRDPARWERRFYSNVLAIDRNNPEDMNPLLDSLINGRATYEWYAASRYGLGLFTIVSDIQDHGRKMDFTDPRIWRGVNRDDNTDNVWSDSYFGHEKYNAYMLDSMAISGTSWELKNVALGSAGGNYVDEGALLLNDVNVTLENIKNLQTFEDCPMVVSPTYPDGISKIVFKTKIVTDATESPQYLYVQVKAGGGWTTEGVSVKGANGTFVKQDLGNPTATLITPTQSLTSVTVKVDEEATGNAGAQFRILRVTSFGNEVTIDDAYATTILIRELRVSSATPMATIGAPQIKEIKDNEAKLIGAACNVYNVEKNEGERYTVNFKITPDDDENRVPRGYEASLGLSRRADSDEACGTYSAAMEVDCESLVASFMGIDSKRLSKNALGAFTNVAENSFCRDEKGNVVSLLPGVYNLTLDCKLLGSFEAGRDVLDKREQTTLLVKDLPVDENDSAKGSYPLTLEVREQLTHATQIDMVLTYRTRAGDSFGYVMNDTEVNFIPDGREERSWYAMLPKEIAVSAEGNIIHSGDTEKKDPDAGYAWVADATDEDAEYHLNLVNFRVRVRQPNGTEYWFGQNETVVDGGMPTTLPAYPGSTISLTNGVELTAGATSKDIVPILVDVSELSATHLCVTFKEPEHIATQAGTLSVCGANEQDFNTWDAASNGLFADTEFHENVKSAVADFDAIISGDGKISRGWIPDQGPLATTSEITDHFTVGRAYGDNKQSSGDIGISYQFFVGDLANIAADYFASWGASSEPASHKYLREDEDDSRTWTEGFEFGSSYGNQVVLKLDANSMIETPSGYQPDAMVRLSGNATIEQSTSARSDITLLKGIGEVRFKLSRSEPYAINRIVFCSDSSKTFKGVGTTIAINDKTKSGYSTSLYLCNVGLTSTYYELRLSQIFIYQDGRERPQERVVMELWQWTGGIATRKSFEVDNSTTDYHVTNQASMQNKEARLWIDGAGFLNASFANKTIKSTSTVPQTTLTHIAFGSAECWPIFNSIVYMNATNGAFEGLTYTPDTTKVELLTSDAKWVVNSASGSQLQLQRGKRPADTSAQVRLDGYSASAGKSEQLAVFTAGDTEQEYSITVGRADLSLSLVATVGNEVFIDDLTVSSWQGDDTNRNGTKVPLYTNTHWNESETDGFSAVGVWVQPVDESQNSAQPTEYTGEQCLLMQYSRRNTSNGLSAGSTNNIHHTASTLALYTPYSSDNFGTISFRYRIPLQSEFKDNVQNPSVSLLLQYTNARSSHTDNLNDSYPLSSWENVSTEIELPITNGEWRTMSITPRLLENSKYVSMERGILRLVMVSPIDSTDDPYVYLDDFRITSSSGEVALWSAGNIRLSEEPIASLYWKDRLAKNINEKTFAWKSRLTRAVLFNDHITEDVVGGIENPLLQSYVESPILEKGAGIISFAARLDEPSLENHYVYVYGYESETIDAHESLSFPDDYTYLTRVKIEDTLYRQYDVDLTKIIPNYKSLKRIRLHVPVEGGVVDGRNGVPQVEAYGRIWLDKLSITEPIAPSVRLSNVCFSTLPGDNFEKHTKVLEGASGIFDVADGRNSPLSQPLAGSPLAVKVTVDRLQQVKKDSIKVFFTWDIPTEMKRVTSDYSYLNALDTRVEAATTPIYTWDPSIETNVIISENLGETKLSYETAAGKLNGWGLDAWFATKRTAIEDTFMRLDAAENKANYDALTASGLESLTSLQGNTILLTRQGEPSEKQTFTTTSNDADKFDEIKKLKANALVRYAVWAVFETEDSTEDNPRYGYSIIDAGSYTDFPWYFPRNLNTEMRTRYNELASNAENAGVGAFDTKGSSFFTPYFWLYDTVPGEVFINEFNMNTNDASSSSMKRFIEFCTPAKNTMDGWFADISDANLLSTVETFAIKDEGTPLVPDPGAVPAQGGSTPLSNRTFYTIINANSNLIANNENVTSEPHKNAGRAQTGLYSGYERTNSAAVALRLYRPTGGAEHIVLYSLWQDGQGSSVNAESRLDALATKYRTAYKQEGFGTEWFQSFREEDWESSTNNPDANYKPADHARRLAVVKTFKTNADGVYDKNGTTDSFIGDARTSNKSRVNSIATIDMGGAWVMRTNANEAKGQLDVSHLFTSPFNMTLNLVEQARPGDTKKDVQVTPRQINLDQWLIYYADPNGNTISSQVNGLGQHMVDFLDENGVSTTTIFGGRDMIYRTIPDGSKVQVTYKAFPFNKLETVTLTATSTEDGVAVETEDELKNLIVEDATAFSVTYAPNPNQPNMMVATFTPMSEEGMVLQLKPELSDGTKYSFTVSASYAVAPEGAKDIITEVSPFCGDALTGDAKYQPWCGSAFGFSVKYDTAALAAKNARLVGAIITYPTPNQLGGADWMGLNSVSVSGNEIPAFTGLTFDQAKLAMNQLGEAGYLRSAALDLTRKVDDSVSEIYSPTCVTVLGDSYMVADSNGVIVKEPKIPYLAWGIYAVTVQSGATTETVQYLIPQDFSTSRYAWPKWYAPLTQEGTIPYFYLYSTPPESVWLNEVNLVKGAGNDAFVEVVIPKLRQGILDAGVPQITTEGWKVQYTVPGGTATDWVDLSDAQALDAISSFSYKLVAKTATDVGKDAVAVALIRPCGAGEGGVWTGVTANGGSSIPATTDVSATLGHYIVEGQTDASNTAGSIQLVGGTTTDEFGDILRETRAERTLWRFVASETNGTENEGANGDIGLDSNPEWNRIRVTSTLLNTVYGGSPCGWQAFGYVPTETTVIGATAEESFAANSWVSDITKNNIKRVITYRPRVGYTYDYLTLPAEWMGKVMLVGKRLAKGEEFSQGDLLTLAKSTYAAATTLTDTEKVKAYVGLGGFATAELAGDGTFTGRILFNGNAVVDEASGLLFQDTDDYVIAVILIAEPASATNNLVMAMRPGSIEFGAWLVSQSFYALDENGNPDLTKGGEVVTNPIWDDEIGNGEGEHCDKHGWIYQPLIGDTLSMSAVIRPDNGLYARETIIEEMTSEKPTVVPMLVWALTDKNKVPSDLFTGAASQSATTFLANWDISKLFGAMPAIGDGITADFKKLRTNLQLANSGKSISLPYVKGGILPMTLQGIRGNIDDSIETEDFVEKASLSLQEIESLKKDSEAPYLAFRVMTETELDVALRANDPSTTDDDGVLATIKNEITNGDDSLVDLTATLSMVNAENESIWSEGAILRFAVILVDVETGEIIDCQGVSNFSSDNLPVYCPWYVPEERADVNYVAKTQKAGVAPYAWVYSIGYNDVWINEIRPFRTDSYGSAIELAMRATSVTEVDFGSKKLYRPAQSLDGWKIVVKYAPMPDVTTMDVKEELNWTRSTDMLAMDHPLYNRTIELKSWVPGKRIVSTDATADSIDYYAIATSHNEITNLKFDDVTNPLTAELSRLDYATCLKQSGEYVDDGTGTGSLVPTMDVDQFVYLKTPTIPVELLTEENGKKTKFGDDATIGTMEILPNYDALIKYLNRELGSDYAKDGLVFGIELVRNNGVVADEILFAYKNEVLVDSVGDLLTLDQRLLAITTNETQAFASSNIIRYVNTAIGGLTGNTSILFVDVYEKNGSDLEAIANQQRVWYPMDYSMSSGVSTIPGPNNNTSATFSGAYFKQPYSSMSLTEFVDFISRTYQISASYMGGTLGLNAFEATTPTPTFDLTRVYTDAEGNDILTALKTRASSFTVANLPENTRYRLTLEPVADEWFDVDVALSNAASSQVKVATDLVTTLNTTKKTMTLRRYCIDFDPSKDDNGLGLRSVSTSSYDSALLDTDKNYVVMLVPNKEAQKILVKLKDSAPQDAGYEAWLIASGTPSDVAQAMNSGAIDMSEKYWLGFSDALTDDGANVSLFFSAFGAVENNTEKGVQASVALMNGATEIKQLYADGTLVLVGKETLSDPTWYFIQALDVASDVNTSGGAPRILNIATDCKYFQVVLMSQEDVKKLERKK